MKILIAPWGNPFAWQEVTYKFGDVEDNSKSSLKIIQQAIQPDKTIIIGLDTLATEGKDYKKVRQSAQKKIEDSAKEFGIKNYDVLIAPGVGTFPNGKFSGSALDYYYYIISKLISKFLKFFQKDNLKNIGDKIEVHLDLTHGLNYTTVLTYRAVREILQTLAIFKSVDFKAYSTDPSLPRSKDKNERARPLFIHTIEDSLIKPSPFTEKISQGRPLELINSDSKKSLTPEEKKERENLFRNELKDVRNIDNKELSAFIGALYNGLPLCLFRFYPKKDKLENIINQVLNIYENYVEVKNLKDEKRLKVIKKLKLTKDFKVYNFAYMISTLMYDPNLISSQKKEVKISEVENLTNSLFKFDERFKNRINIDIRNIRRNLKDKKLEEWEIYNKINENDAKNLSLNDRKKFSSSFRI